jgi:predicted O-methyltransferase YrrM
MAGFLLVLFVSCRAERGYMDLFEGWDWDLSKIRTQVLRSSLMFLKQHKICLKQVPSELDDLFQFLLQCDRDKNQVLVELGVLEGGSARVLADLVSPGGRIILVDDFKRPWRRDVVRVVEQELRKRYDVEVIQSTTQQALRQIEKEVAGKIDYLHIDADHTYSSVKWDFENYLPLLQKGGLIQLHDIYQEGKPKGHKGEDYGVYKLWQELKQCFWQIEFVDQKVKVTRSGMSGSIGIGLVFT